MAEIVVAIPTFRRPKSLARLLSSLAALRTAARVSVLVADNDAQSHEGADLCAALEPHYRWPLAAIVVAERGIAQVRNALVARALKDNGWQFLAMIDDDEWPSPAWIDQFLRVAGETGADALQGSIVFEGLTSDVRWARDREGIRSIRRATGPTDMLQGAGNLFLTRACLEDLAPPWFDPAFALTGGEDREFFVRLKAEGRRFAWADGAVAFGDVPEARLSLKWVLARAYSVGNSDMRVALKHWPGIAARLSDWAKIAAALLLSPLLFVIVVLDPIRRTNALALFFRAMGKAAAMLGFTYNAYSVTHGD